MAYRELFVNARNFCQKSDVLRKIFLSNLLQKARKLLLCKDLETAKTQTPKHMILAVKFINEKNFALL